MAREEYLSRAKDHLFMTGINDIGIMEKNKYLLTMMIAKRAKQLLAGAKPLIKTKFKNPVAIALKEIEEGKVYLKKQKDLKKEDLFKSVFRFRSKEEDQELEFKSSVGFFAKEGKVKGYHKAKA